MATNIQTLSPTKEHENTSHSHETFKWQWLFFIAAIDWWSTIAFWNSGAYQDMGVLAPFAALYLVVAVIGVYQLINYGMTIESTGKGTIGVLLKTFGVNSPLAIGIRIYFFAATVLDIAFTEALEVPDAVLHIVENPVFKPFVHPMEEFLIHNFPSVVNYFGKADMALVCIGAIVVFFGIAALFWKRSAEAVIGCAMVIGVFVSIYSAALIAALPDMIAATPAYLARLAQECPSGMACFVKVLHQSPGQALGLSGVEAMPFLIPLIYVGIAIKLEEDQIATRVRGVKNILRVAAIGMSFLLLTSIWMAVTLISPEMVGPGGVAKDRATSWIMHHYLGDFGGTLGDIALILMLGLASSSVVPVLINAYPRILGPLGVHPQFLRRKVVICVQTALCIAIAIHYKADVKLMTGSYAVGVMQLLAGLSIAGIVDLWLNKISLKKKFILTGFGFFVVYTAVSVLILKPEGFQNFRLALIGVTIYVVVGNLVRAFDKRADGLKAWVNLGFRADQIAHNGDVSIVAVASLPRNMEAIQEHLQKVFLPEGRTPVFLNVNENSRMNFGDNIHCDLNFVEGYPMITAEAKSWVVAVPLIIHAIHELGKKPHVNFLQVHGAPVVAQNYELLYGEPDEDDKKRPIFHGPIYGT